MTDIKTDEFYGLLVEPWLLTLSEKEIERYGVLKNGADLEKIGFFNDLADAGATRVNQISLQNRMVDVDTFGTVWLIKPDCETVLFDWHYNNRMRDFKHEMAIKYAKKTTIGVRANAAPCYIAADGQHVSERPEHYASRLSFNLVEAARGKKITLQELIKILRRRLAAKEAALANSYLYRHLDRVEQQELEIKQIENSIRLARIAMDLHINGSITVNSGHGLYLSVRGHYNKCTVPNIALIPCVQNYEVVIPHSRERVSDKLKFWIGPQLVLRCETEAQVQELRHRADLIENLL